MREKYCLAWLFIFISSNLFAEAQGSFNVQVKAVENNHSCVDVSWETEDSAQYAVNCNGALPVGPEPDQTLSPQRVCRDYQPYTLVQCTVTATSEGTSGNNTGRTACAKPSLPTFEVKDEIGYQAQSDGTPVTRRKITVYDVAVEKLNCGSIREVTVRVYKKSQNEKWVDAGSDRSTNSIKDRYGINNLDAITEYQVRVEVENDNTNRNENYMTAEQYITTGELPPGPVDNLTSSSSSPKCVDLTWLVPADPRGKITTYTVNCTRDGQRPVRDNTDELHIRVCQFSGYQLVNCSVGAKNKFYGTPTITSTRTKCDPPSIPQFQLSEELSVDETRREISVKEIMVEPNCESLQEIIIELYNGDQRINSSEITSTQSSMTFSNLDAVTYYIVKVVAVNNENQQSENSSSIRTGELAPGSPPSGFKRSFNSSCVSLSWSEPTEPNGLILNYMVSCWNLTETLTKNAVDHTFCGFSSATQINCSVSANNSIGWSPAATSSGYTAPKLASKSIQPTQIETTANEIRITINPVAFTKSNLTVEYYQFIVETVSPSVRKKRDVSAVDVNQLLDAAAAEAQGLSYYVAGKISDQTGKTIEFRFGDNEMYEGFHNTKLKKSVQYKIHYTYTVELGNTFQTYLVESQASYELKLFSDIEIALIVIGGVLVVIGLIILITCCCKRQPIVCCCIQSAQGQGPGPSILAQGRELTSSNATVLDIDVKKDTFAFTKMAVADNNDMQHDNDHPRPSGANARRSGSDGTVQAEIAGPSQQAESSFIGEQSPEQSYNPSAVQENEGSREGINRFVEGAAESRGTEIKFCKEDLNRSIRQDENKREEEFKNLRDPRSYRDSISVARILENSEKNRYKRDERTWPTDQHRVILIDNPNPNGSDYINASFICGFDKEEKFIAAMGPNSRSLNDFWWMLWQIKVETVVMLCKSFEGGERKCEQYWPEVQKCKKYGPLTVETCTEDSWAHFIIRTIQISHEGRQTHRVMHYQYTSWPDHEVPKRTAPFVMFYEMIKHREKQLASKIPIVVHCSAGVGRTGTFIAVDCLVEQGEKVNKLNFYQCVSLLRERRPSMVQTAIQYHFLHWALLHILENKQFQTDVSMLPNKIEEARASPAQCVLAEEYRTIEHHVDLRFSIAEPDLTRTTVPAGDESRIYLQDRGEDGSDDINAISVCSYKDIRKFIVAENPTSSLLRAFWVMIHEQKVTNIVQLDSSQLSHIPVDNRTIPVKGYKIRHVNSEIKGNIELIKLHMTPAHSKGKEYEEITVYKYLDWKDENTPPSEKSIIELYKAVRLSSSTYINSPLVITCRNGATKSGLFVNIYSILEKMEIEQIVDIYRSVQLTRIIRPDFINKLEDYIYLHVVVNTYKERFATYSNLEPPSQNQNPDLVVFNS